MNIGQCPENHTRCPRSSGRKQKGMPTCMLHVLVRRFCFQGTISHRIIIYRFGETHSWVSPSVRKIELSYQLFQIVQSRWIQKGPYLGHHIYSFFFLLERQEMNSSDSVQYEPTIPRSFDVVSWMFRVGIRGIDGIRGAIICTCLQIILPIFFSQVGYHKHKPCSAGTQCGQCPCGDESTILVAFFITSLEMILISLDNLSHGQQCSDRVYDAQPSGCPAVYLIPHRMYTRRKLRLDEGENTVMNICGPLLGRDGPLRTSFVDRYLNQLS